MVYYGSGCDHSQKTERLLRVAILVAVICGLSFPFVSNLLACSSLGDWCVTGMSKEAYVWAFLVFVILPIVLISGVVRSVKASRREAAKRERALAAKQAAEAERERQRHEAKMGERERLLIKWREEVAEARRYGMPLPPCPLALNKNRASMPYER